MNRWTRRGSLQRRCRGLATEVMDLIESLQEITKDKALVGGHEDFWTHTEEWLQSCRKLLPEVEDIPTLQKWNGIAMEIEGAQIQFAASLGIKEPEWFAKKITLSKKTIEGLSQAPTRN